MRHFITTTITRNNQTIANAPIARWDITPFQSTFSWQGSYGPQSSHGYLMALETSQKLGDSLRLILTNTGTIMLGLRTITLTALEGGNGRCVGFRIHHSGALLGNRDVAVSPKTVMDRLVQAHRLLSPFPFPQSPLKSYTVNNLPISAPDPKSATVLGLLVINPERLERIITQGAQPPGSGIGPLLVTEIITRHGESLFL